MPEEINKYSTDPLKEISSKLHKLTSGENQTDKQQCEAERN